MDIQGMKIIKKALLIFSLAMFVTAAHANTVTVSNLVDGDGNASLWTGTVTQSGAMGENISLDINNFVAGTAGTLGAGGGVSALDTLFATLTAPSGYVITSLSYAEGGNIETTNGFAVATGSLVADGIATNLLAQVAGPGTALQSWTIGPVAIAIDNKTSIDVSFVNSLVASGFGGAGDIARVEKTGALVTIGLTELTAVPLPPAVWLMGAAAAALVSVGRRQSV
ncbi:MAG: hypothetical protein ACI915_000641 [Gammaproteobacteria bacterium]|jgi:hypothetical protein